MKAAGTKRTTVTVDHRVELPLEAVVALLREHFNLPTTASIRCEHGHESVELDGEGYNPPTFNASWTETSVEEVPIVMDAPSSSDAALPRRPKLPKYPKHARDVPPFEPDDPDQP